MYVICKPEVTAENILWDLIHHWSSDGGSSNIVWISSDKEEVGKTLLTEDLKWWRDKPLTYKECGYVIKKIKLTVEE